MKSNSNEKAPNDVEVNKEADNVRKKFAHFQEEHLKMVGKNDWVSLQKKYMNEKWQQLPLDEKKVCYFFVDGCWI
jgi:hypothetical protein